MILEQLIVQNFGLFRGEQSFDLSPAVVGGRHRPIVLFGGINGGGKTTLLDAIRLALYGGRAKCSKRTDLSYEEFLRASIHQGIHDGEHAGVSLTFRYALDGHEHLYNVRRIWSLTEDRLREELRVDHDGLFDAWITDNWQQLVEELFPLDISQLFFFDAEKIRTLAEDESSSKALEAAIKSLLGLDMVERLIADSVVLQTRLARRVGSAQERAQAAELEERIGQLRARLQQLLAERSTLENTRLRAVEEQRAAEAEFSSAGGRHWEEREGRRRRVEELNAQARDREAELCGLAASELPFAMVGDLLVDVEEQDERERQAAEADLIDRLLAGRDEELVGFLRRMKAAARVVDRVEAHLQADRKARRPVEPTPRRLGLAEPSRQLLRELRGRTLGSLDERARDLCDRLESIRREREDLDRAEAATPEESDIGQFIERLRQATQRAALLNDQAKRLDEAIAPLRTELKEAEGQMERLVLKRVEEEFAAEDHRRMLQLAEQTGVTMQEFLKRVTVRKIDRLSTLITESFQYLLRKSSFIARISIDPLTFAITLFDAQGRGVPKQRLSEGEKQIFAISILWGLARAAARPLPAVIDTPMARLDATHRRHLVERYFPHASHQVVVFSTDTEVDREYYRLLQPAIARAYHLNYDETERFTVGQPGYFWDGQATLEGA
jgi:DNA sulfur modification protein DndD